VQENKIVLIILSAFLVVVSSTHDASAKMKTKLSKPATLRKDQAGVYTKIFEKDWKQAVIDFSQCFLRDGFKYGIGSQMTVTVDGVKKASGIFLGRMANLNNQITYYMFEDYADKKYYMIDEARVKVPPNYLKKDIQTVYETVEQFEDTCVVASMKNFSLALLEAHVEGNGKLRADVNAGRIDKIGDAAFNFYYNDPKTGGNYEPLLRWYEGQYGLKCSTITLGDKTTPTESEFAGNTYRELGAGLPVILEFYIGPDMVTAESQWVDTGKASGEDRRFWAPRAPTPGRMPPDGHAIVAEKSLEIESGRTKLLIKDGDWEIHPVLWDSKLYFESRIKSSGMIAHFCENAPKK
jgi:hypothetical protein